MFYTIFFLYRPLRQLSNYNICNYLCFCCRKLVSRRDENKVHFIMQYLEPSSLAMSRKTSSRQAIEQRKVYSTRESLKTQKSQIPER